MILIDLKKTRHIDFMKLSTEEIPSVFDNWKFSDQDMINYVFEHNILLLDIKWNFSYPFPNYYKDIDYYNKTSKDPAIIHWIERKPWIPKVRNAHMVEEYFKYLKLSPWNSLEWFINYIIEGNLVILDAIWAIHSKLRIKPETELIKFQEDSRY